MKKFFKKFLIFLLIFVFTQFFIVYADDEELEDNFLFEELSIPTSSDGIEEPTINARHAIVYDRKSKKAIYGKNENEKCKMASTTKIMTAIVVLENSSLNDEVKVSKKSARNRRFSFRVIHK